MSIYVSGLGDTQLLLALYSEVTANTGHNSEDHVVPEIKPGPLASLACSQPVVLSLQPSVMYIFLNVYCYDIITKCD